MSTNMPLNCWFYEVYITDILHKNDVYRVCGVMYGSEYDFCRLSGIDQNISAVSGQRDSPIMTVI